jgi:ketosteroid isomerase-like protein
VPDVQAEEVVSALYDAFARRDVEAAVALAHPELEFWPQGTAERVGREEPYRGPDGLRRYFADVERAWEQLRVEPAELRVAGAGVVAFGRVVGRSGGRDVELPAIWVWKLRDGLVAYVRAVATAAEADRVLR